jgi:ABC-type transport system involved in multi-copper enzyme maturation permease subunit
MINVRIFETALLALVVSVITLFLFNWVIAMIACGVSSAAARPIYAWLETKLPFLPGWIADTRDILGLHP